MQNLTMGANAPLDGQAIYASMTWPAAAGALDVSIYMLGIDKRVREDHDMVFFNQPADPSGTVTIDQTAPGHSLVRLDLDCAPVQVAHIVLCLTVEQPECGLAQFNGTSVSISGSSGEGLMFSPNLSSATETAMRMVEFYRRDGGWRVRAIGQGFSEGLAALARSYGISVESDDSSEEERQSGPMMGGKTSDLSDSGQPFEPDTNQGRHRVDEPIPLPNLPPIIPECEERDVTEPPEPTSELIADDHIALNYDCPKHAWLTDALQAETNLTVELRWHSHLAGPVGRLQHLKLELGCYYALTDGSHGIVQSWDNVGHFDRPPFIRLSPAEQIDGSGLQVLNIKGSHVSKFRHLLLYAFIPVGSANWANAAVALIARWGDALPTGVSVEAGVDGNAVVSILAIDVDEQGISLTRQDEYAPRHPDLDAKYGWGLQWQTIKSSLIDLD